MIARHHRLAVPRSRPGPSDLLVEEGEDGDIVQAVFLQAGAAQGTFASEACLVRDPQGREIVGVDVQPHALQAAGGQCPPGEGGQSLGDEAPAAVARADAVVFSKLQSPDLEIISGSLVCRAAWRSSRIQADRPFYAYLTVLSAAQGAMRFP
jgi:hypothetical protein